MIDLEKKLQGMTVQGHSNPCTVIPLIFKDINLVKIKFSIIYKFIANII